MLTVKTWCLPHDLPEEKYKEIHEAIVKAIVSIPETGVKDENGILNLFPKDLMSYGLGTEIVVEISNVPNCGLFLLDKIAYAVGNAVQKIFPHAKIDCDVSPISNKNGRWSSGSNGKVNHDNCPSYGSSAHMQSSPKVCPDCGKP